MINRSQIVWVLGVVGLTVLLLLGSIGPLNAQGKPHSTGTSALCSGKEGSKVTLPFIMGESTGKWEDGALTPKAVGLSEIGVPIEANVVTLGLPRNDMLNTEQFNLKSISFTGEPIAVQGKIDIKSFLESRGIESDVNSRSIIYDLNPNIDRLDLLSPGTVLILPKVEGDSSFENAKKKGYRVTLSRDGGLLKAVNSKQGELEKSSFRLANFEIDRFSSSQDKNAVVNSLDEAYRSLALISSGGFPVSQMVLKQSALEAAYLKNTVDKVSGSAEKIGWVALEDINKAAKALKSRSDDIAMGGSGLGRVDVHTVKKVNLSAVHGLRVFYAPKLNRAAVDICRKPTSPASEALPIGGYFTFWAAAGNKDPTPLSDEISITIQQNNSPIILLVQ